jgi:preprotein translocase subunit SecY
MASSLEQAAAAGLSWSAFSKAEELKKRLVFTVLALIVFRLGTYIPTPGLDAGVLAGMFKQHAKGILGVFDTFAGGALGRMSILALNIMPYISASIIVQLMTAIVPSLEQLKKEGESGRRVINQYTRYLTVFLATIQAYAIATGLERMGSTGGVSPVLNPGLFFQASTVITLVGGTMFLMWLGEQITSRGIGNGTSLIIFTGIVAVLPMQLAQLFELARTGAMPVWAVMLLVVVAAFVVAAIVFMERAQRRILIQYPKRQVGNRIVGGENTHLPLKLNTAGVIPPIFASSLLLLPMTVLNFRQGGDSDDFLSSLATHLGHGQPLYMVMYATLILFFCFFYTAIVFNPAETAENLRKNGGFVPGIRPGVQTAVYFDTILTRLTAIGAVYITLVCLLPEFLTAQMGVPFYFGGTSLLIVVSVTMDTVAQIQSHLMAHQYEHLLKKAKLKGGGR